MRAPHDPKDKKPIRWYRATKNSKDLASYRKTHTDFRISNRPVVGLLPVQKAALNTDGQKMIAARVTESYTSLFLTSKHDDGSRHAAIARIGAFEVRLLEMPSANSPEEASLWVELYDRGLRVGVDSYKCGDLDEAIDVAQLLMNQATRLNSEAGEVALFAFGRSNEVIK